VKTDCVQFKAPGRHCQTSASRTALIEQRIDAMLHQGITDPEADDMDLVLSVDNISNDSQPEKVIPSYLGGYVAHKLSSCFDCVQLLTETSSTCYSGPDAKLVELKSRGRLKVPSLAPMKLLEFLEQCIQNHAAKPCVDIYTRHWHLSS